MQACPNEAIRIGIVDLAEVRSLYRNRDGTSKEPLKNSFLPDSPAPHYTLPTTRYRTAKDWSEVRRGDHYRNDPQPTHGPLVLMLVLTQAGIGGWIGSLFLVNSQLFGLLAGGSLGLFCSGLVASVFHLGQPLKAWRVWMGWRTSWLSREAIALNSFVGCALGLTAFLILGDGSMGSRSLELAWIVGGGLAFTAILAQCGVYTDTGRHFWNWRQTAVRFYGTSWILGFSLHAWIAPGPIPMFSILIGTFIKMSAELSVLLGEKNGNQPVSGQIQRTQRLLKGVLRFHFLSRILVGVISGIVLPLLGIAGFGFPGLASSIVIGCFAAELMERALFFRAVAPDKMPGFQ